jgi:hypothetical protein
MVIAKKTGATPSLARRLRKAEKMLASRAAMWCNASCSLAGALLPLRFCVRSGFTDLFKEVGTMSRVTTPPVGKPLSHGMTTSNTPQPLSNVSVPREKIAMRAYEKWLKSGCPHGQDRQHWLEAEAELKAEMARQTTR